MISPSLIETREELRQNTFQFADNAAALVAKKNSVTDAIGNGCSHAVEWVAFQNDAGEWKVGFCKFVGYKKLSFKSYDQFRVKYLSGTDAKRRVEKFGGTYYGVGPDAGVPANHPAVDAVKALCGRFGKLPKSTAKVRVFPIEIRPAVMDVLLAAIRAANLNHEEIKNLFNEINDPPK